jgi:hypothetical protein
MLLRTFMKIEFTLVREVILLKEERNSSRTVIARKGAILFFPQTFFKKATPPYVSSLANQPTNQQSTLSMLLWPFMRRDATPHPTLRGLITLAASSTIHQHLRL